MSITHLLSIDPGGKHTGIVLAEATSSGPPNVLAGITLERRTSDRSITGLPAYVDRFVDFIPELLDKHGVDLGSLFVFVEGYTPTRVEEDLSTTDVEEVRKVVRDTAGLLAILGATAALFPKAMRWEVPPNHHDEKGKLIAPKELRNRHPKGWMRDGADRSHQCSAYSVMIDGVQAVRKWRPGLLPSPEPTGADQRPATAPVAEDLVDFDDDGDASGADELVDLVLAKATAAGGPTPTRIVEAVRSVLVSATVDDQLLLAWGAAVRVQPETDRLADADKEALRQRLRSRLVAC